MATAANQNKLILRKKELKNLANCKEITTAPALGIVELDLSFNSIE